MKHLFFALTTVLLAGCSPTLDDTQPDVRSIDISLQKSTADIVCVAEGSYPYITNLSSTQIETNINSTIESYVYALREDIEECPAMMADLAQEGTQLIDTTDIDYAVKRLDDQYFSVTLLRSQYFEGAAHPSNSITTYTFDLSDGQPIALDAWFADPVAGETFLMDQINTQLAADGMQTEYPSETSNDLGTYYLTDTDLVLTDLFAVHAMQGYEVRIPFIKLQDVLSPGATL